MNALALRMQRREGFEEEDEMYTVRRGNANDFVWGFVLGTFVVIERQLPGYSPLCVCLLCGSRLFLWIFHAVLRTSLVEGCTVGVA